MVVKRCAWGTCDADSRYPERYPGIVFIPFVKPKRELDKCLRWIRACGRPHTRLSVDKIRHWTYICSRHFVDGLPTAENPDPVPAIADSCLPARKHKAPARRCDPPPTKMSRKATANVLLKLQVVRTGFTSPTGLASSTFTGETDRVVEHTQVNMEQEVRMEPESDARAEEHPGVKIEPEGDAVAEAARDGYFGYSSSLSVKMEPESDTMAEKHPQVKMEPESDAVAEHRHVKTELESDFVAEAESDRDVAVHLDFGNKLEPQVSSDGDRDRDRWSDVKFEYNQQTSCQHLMHGIKLESQVSSDGDKDRNHLSDVKSECDQKASSWQLEAGSFHPNVPFEIVSALSPRAPCGPCEQHGPQGALGHNGLSGHNKKDTNTFNSTVLFTQMSRGHIGDQRVKLEPCVMSRTSQQSEIDSFSPVAATAQLNGEPSRATHVNPLMLTPPSAQLRGGRCEHKRVKQELYQMSDSNSVLGSRGGTDCESKNRNDAVHSKTTEQDSTTRTQNTVSVEQAAKVGKSCGLEGLGNYYKCEECRTSFTSFENFLAHTRKYCKGEEQPACHVCHFSFTDLYGLERFTQNCIPKSRPAVKKPHECSDCGARFSSQHWFDHHTAVHNSTSCKDPGGRFPALSLRREHKRTNYEPTKNKKVQKNDEFVACSGRQPYKCLKCGHSYKLAESYMAHFFVERCQHK